MRHTCDEVQTAIAVESELSAAVRAHIVSCETCGRLFEEYLKLKELVQAADCAVPSGFADRVMNAVSTVNDTEESTEYPVDIARRWIKFSLPRWVSVGAGGILSALGFIHFVFSVLIPT